MPFRYTLCRPECASSDTPHAASPEPLYRPHCTGYVPLISSTEPLISRSLPAFTFPLVFRSVTDVGMTPSPNEKGSFESIIFTSSAAELDTPKNITIIKTSIPDNLLIRLSIYCNSTLTPSPASTARWYTTCPRQTS